MDMAGQVILDQFQFTLRDLSSRRDSIQNASRQVTENPNSSGYLIQAIGEVIPSKDKMACFFLLDSIAQNAAKTKQTQIVERVGQCLKQHIKTIIGSPIQVDIKRIEKAVTFWKARGVFPPEFIRCMDQMIKNTAKTKPTEGEIILRKIEEIRRSQKIAQYRSALRPEGEEPFAEMKEIIAEVEEEIRERQIEDETNVVMRKSEWEKNRGRGGQRDRERNGDRFGGKPYNDRSWHDRNRERGRYREEDGDIDIRRERERGRNSGRERDRERGRTREGERGRDYGRDHERDHGRDHERGRNDERKFGRGTNTNRDRERDRDRDRERERERDRRRTFH